VSCFRHHDQWKLDLAVVRQRLDEEQRTGKRQRYGTRPRP
jgi:hypothetical protein